VETGVVGAGARGRADIVAAGAIVFRPGSKGGEVLLVHRPKYDDWSFPKGKRDRGEQTVSAAVREVEEETGLRIRLARPLTTQRYPTSRGMKRVFYWIGRVRDDAVAPNTFDIADYVPNPEIDQVRWVPVEEAATLLSYPHDRDTLAEALTQPKRTETVVVVRHALSRARSRWHDQDQLRPLLATGRTQALHLVPALAAYGVTRVVSSPSVRCLDTVAPYADTAGLTVETEPLLSEEDARPKATRERVRALVGREPTAICTHRPVMAPVAAALDLDDPGLEKGEVLVVHLRKGVPIAVERL
jgi:8-oxo-(d)GTP phosphatase